jgi:hypothetical protein
MGIDFNSLGIQLNKINPQAILQVM